MSSLQVGLAVAGGLILGGVIAYNTWNARRSEAGSQTSPGQVSTSRPASERRSRWIRARTTRPWLRSARTRFPPKCPDAPVTTTVMMFPQKRIGWPTRWGGWRKQREAPVERSRGYETGLES